MTAAEVLARYSSEDLPDFVGREIVDVNQKGIFGNGPLHIAAVRGSLEEVKALIAGGASVEMSGEEGNTALHEACAQGHVDIVKFLLEMGADIDARNEMGLKPEEVARITEQAAVVELVAGWRGTACKPSE